MYYGNFNVNNGTTLPEGMESRNLNKLTKELKELATGQIFAGNSGTITITEGDDNGYPPYVDVAVYVAKWFYPKTTAPYCKWFKANQ